jgi:hypothetical protein
MDRLARFGVSALYYVSAAETATDGDWRFHENSGRLENLGGRCKMSEFCVKRGTMHPISPGSEVRPETGLIFNPGETGKTEIRLS